MRHRNELGATQPGTSGDDVAVIRTGWMIDEDGRARREQVANPSPASTSRGEISIDTAPTSSATRR
jgi:hypothetical protein